MVRGEGVGHDPEDKQLKLLTSSVLRSSSEDFSFMILSSSLSWLTACSDSSNDVDFSIS